MEIDSNRLSGMTAAELGDLRNQLVAELRDVMVDGAGEVRGDGEYDVQASARINRQLDKVDGHLKIREALERRGAAVALGGNNGRRNDPLTDLDPGEALRMGREEARDRALRALEVRGRKLDPDQQDRVEGLLRSQLSEDNQNLDGTYIAKRTLITETDAYRSAWKRLVTQPHPLLTPQEIEAVRALERLEVEYRAMSENTTTAGGFGVPVFIDPSIVLTAQGADNPFFELAKSVTITTNQWKGVSSAGVSWAFQTEAAEVTDNSPTLAQPSVTVHMEPFRATR
jgi:hypothetical protein